MLHVAIALGALLITRACVLSGEAASFYSVWFIWIGLYVFYFFSRSAAAVHMAFVAGLYAATLAHRTPTSAVARWLTTVATLIVAGRADRRARAPLAPPGQRRGGQRREHGIDHRARPSS